jgi:hypothetical protein
LSISLQTLILLAFAVFSAEVKHKSKTLMDFSLSPPGFGISCFLVFQDRKKCADIFHKVFAVELLLSKGFVNVFCKSCRAALLLVGILVVKSRPLFWQMH